MNNPIWLYKIKKQKSTLTEYTTDTQYAELKTHDGYRVTCEKVWARK